MVFDSALCIFNGVCIVLMVFSAFLYLMVLILRVFNLLLLIAHLMACLVSGEVATKVLSISFAMNPNGHKFGGDPPKSDGCNSPPPPRGRGPRSPGSRRKETGEMTPTTRGFGSRRGSRCPGPGPGLGERTRPLPLRLGATTRSDATRASAFLRKKITFGYLGWGGGRLGKATGRGSKATGFYYIGLCPYRKKGFPHKAFTL